MNYNQANLTILNTTRSVAGYLNGLIYDATNLSQIYFYLTAISAVKKTVEGGSSIPIQNIIAVCGSLYDAISQPKTSSLNNNQDTLQSFLRQAAIMTGNARKKASKTSFLKGTDAVMKQINAIFSASIYTKVTDNIISIGQHRRFIDQLVEKSAKTQIDSSNITQFCSYFQPDHLTNPIQIFKDIVISLKQNASKIGNFNDMGECTSLKTWEEDRADYDLPITGWKDWLTTTLIMKESQEVVNRLRIISIDLLRSLSYPVDVIKKIINPDFMPIDQTWNRIMDQGTNDKSNKNESDALAHKGLRALINSFYPTVEIGLIGAGTNLKAKPPSSKYELTSSYNMPGLVLYFYMFLNMMRDSSLLHSNPLVNSEAESLYIFKSSKDENIFDITNEYLRLANQIYHAILLKCALVRATANTVYTSVT